MTWLDTSDSRAFQAKILKHRYGCDATFVLKVEDVVVINTQLS